MSGYIVSGQATLTSGQKDIPILKLEVEKGYKYHLLGLAGSIAQNGEIKVFLDTTEIANFNKGLIPDASHVLPVDDELTEGKTLTVAGTNSYAGDNLMQFLVQFEKLPI